MCVRQRRRAALGAQWRGRPEDRPTPTNTYLGRPTNSDACVVMAVMTSGARRPMLLLERQRRGAELLSHPAGTAHMHACAHARNWRLPYRAARHGTARLGAARHGTARHFTALHRLVQHSTVQHHTAPHSTAPTALPRTPPQPTIAHTAWHCSAPHRTAPHRTVLHPVQHHAAPHCTTLHCTAHDALRLQVPTHTQILMAAQAHRMRYSHRSQRESRAAGGSGGSCGAVGHVRASIDRHRCVGTGMG